MPCMRRTTKRNASAAIGFSGAGAGSPHHPDAGATSSTRAVRRASLCRGPASAKEPQGASHGARVTGSASAGRSAERDRQPEARQIDQSSVAPDRLRTSSRSAGTSGDQRQNPSTSFEPSGGSMPAPWPATLACTIVSPSVDTIQSSSQRVFSTECVQARVKELTPARCATTTPACRRQRPFTVPWPARPASSRASGAAAGRARPTPAR